MTLTTASPAPLVADAAVPRDAADAPAAPRVSPYGGRLALGVIAAGIVVIALGWYGASGNGGKIAGVTDVRAQLPYLLSGGFFGLSLVVLGSALLVVQSARLERARNEALLEARFDRLAGALGVQLATPLPPDGVIAGSAAYHRPDCRLVDGRPGQTPMARAAAEDLGLRPCRHCMS